MSDQPVRINTQEVVWREVGDEVVILHMTTATYLTINGSGRLLWNLLAEGATPEALAQTLVGEYDIGFEQAEADVRTFLSSLTECSLLEKPR